MTAQRRAAGWQRALRWVAWLAFLGLAIANANQTSFGALEFLALAAAIAISIWCTARPLGGPKIDLTDIAQVQGAFVSRTNWGLLLIGAVLTVGGIGGSGAMVYDLSTGRSTIGEILTDIAIFIEGWILEVFTRGGFDAELEQTRGYALFLLLIPGLLLLLFNIAPLVRRGSEFSVDRRAAGWRCAGVRSAAQLMPEVPGSGTFAAARDGAGCLP